MPTCASSSANAELDRDGSGFFITFAIEEGELYKFGDVKIESSSAGVDPRAAAAASC